MNKAYPVSVVLRDLCLDAHPMLRNNEAYRKLFARLMFKVGFNDDGHMPLPVEVLAEIEGKEEQLKSRNYVGKTFINNFMRDVCGIMFKLHSGKREWKHYPDSDAWNECRMVVMWDPFDELSQAMATEKNGGFSFSPMVDFVTGEPLTKKIRLSIAEQAHDDMMARLSEAHCPEAAAIIEYMADVSVSKMYKLVERNLDKLEAAIKAAYPEDVYRFEEKREAQRLAAKRLVYFPKQEYGTTPGTSRLSPKSEGLATVHKEVRKALMSGCYDIDIHHSQLSIAAKIWDLPLLSEYLKTGKSLWDDLMARLKATDAKQRKAIKNATYATLYGASTYQRYFSQQAIANRAGTGKERDTSIKGILEAQNMEYRKFASHPIIREALRARKAQLEQISKDGGAMDCFGVWLAHSHKTSRKNKTFSATSILAQLSQAWELLIMYQTVVLCKEAPKSHGFDILLWQHDGITISLDRPTDSEYWLARINDCVVRRAKELGFNLHMEYEKL